MIVKVQVPLVSNELTPPALVYDRHRSRVFTLPLDELPDHVFEAARVLGKAYFHIAFDGNDRILWGEQAPRQEW
jgi:hypothetical protein